MDKQTDIKEKRISPSPANGHSPEIRKRIEQASEKILKRNFELYRRLENK